MIAVITSFYNGDSVRYAELALESIRKQSIGFDNIRIYIHIDGNLDLEHEEYLNRNKLYFHKVLRSKENIGLAKGLNRLLPLIREDFIFRMDLDDVSYVDRFSCQLKYFEDNKGLGLIGCNADEINEFNDIEYTRIFPENHKEISKSLMKVCPILHPTFCFRRELIEMGIRYPDYHLTEDLGFIFKAYQKGVEFGNCQEILFAWRKTAGFYKRRTIRRSIVEFSVYIKIIFEIKPISFSYIFPLSRLIFRFFPNKMVKVIYNSNLRNSLLRK